MANSASLLLPVSNLTNLLAMRYVGLTFVGFASVMAPVLAVVLVVEYVAARLLFRRELTEAADPAHRRPGRARRCPRLPWSPSGRCWSASRSPLPLGVEPFWVSGAAAVVLLALGRAAGRVTLAQAVHAGHPAFAIFVLCLGWWSPPWPSVPSATGSATSLPAGRRSAPCC